MITRAERYQELLNELNGRLHAIACEEAEKLAECDQLRKVAMPDLLNRVPNTVCHQFATLLKANEQDIREQAVARRESAHAEFQQSVLALVTR
jgi:hypothetical protein